MYNILITGANGFIGSNLYEIFHEDFNLSGLDIINDGRFPSNSVYHWDEIEKVPSADIIIHLAGKAHDVNNKTDEKTYFDINLGLTEKIFNYFLNSEAKKFIFFSSVKAVADKVQDRMLTESSEPMPETPYGKSKLAAENYILGKIIPENKKVYILRPCMVHGPENKGNLNSLYNLVRKGIPYPLGAFNNLRSFTSIDNLAFIIREIIVNDIDPGIYQVADDEPLSTNELIKLAAGSLNKRPCIVKIPKIFVKGFARMGDYISLPLNSERLKKLTDSYVVSNSKIKTAIGISNLPLSSRSGLIKTFNSFSQ